MTVAGRPRVTRRPCPVCATGPEAAEIFVEESIDEAKLSGFSFASRKAPEHMSHRMVRCPTCDLVYADEPPDERELAHAYHAADFDSSDEADDAAAAYLRAIGPALAGLVRRERALEIGTGTGAFLDRLAGEGFTELVGVEPSSAAIAAAPEHRRPWIREAMFDEADFAPASFDLICCFMTMEHVRDPATVANAAMRLLRPGGAFVTVTHDYRGLVNRVLGRRSPIVDIEHLQLFSDTSLRYLFEHTGFQRVAVRPFANRYRVRYWARLAPLPGPVQKATARVLDATGAGRVKLRCNVGNLISTGFRPS